MNRRGFQVIDWCTENYFGRWLTCKAECPVLIPLTEEKFQQAALDAAEMTKIFDKKGEDNDR